MLLQWKQKLKNVTERYFIDCLKMATGTSLDTLLLPFGALGVLEYSRQGQISVMAALLLAIGMFIGAFRSAKLSLNLPATIINRTFAIFLFTLALRYFFLGASFSLKNTR